MEYNNPNKGKLDFNVEDWSKIKYLVKCHWGVHVDSRYPNPVINEYYYENFQDVEEFVSWYETENQSLNKKILMIAETCRFFQIETYEVASKVRLK